MNSEPHHQACLPLGWTCIFGTILVSLYIVAVIRLYFSSHSSLFLILIPLFSRPSGGSCPRRTSCIRVFFLRMSQATPHRPRRPTSGSRTMWFAIRKAPWCIEHAPISDHRVSIRVVSFPLPDIPQYCRRVSVRAYGVRQRCCVRCAVLNATATLRQCVNAVLQAVCAGCCDLVALDSVTPFSR